MSSHIRDAIEEHARLATKIQNFMWEGKPHKSKKIERTKEEYEALLEEIRVAQWEEYNTQAEIMGWRDF